MDTLFYVASGIPPLPPVRFTQPPDAPLQADPNNPEQPTASGKNTEPPIGKYRPADGNCRKIRIFVIWKST